VDDETPRAEQFGRPRSNRRRRRLGIVVSAALLALVGGGLFAALSNSNSGVSHPLVDQTDRPAPSFSLPDLLTPSRTVSLADFKGKDLVVNFWASWCDACRTETPLLESAYKSERGSVDFLGIDTNDTRGAAIAFLSKVHASYQSLFDPNGQMASAYGLFGLPTTVFISASGRMLGRHLGQLDAATLQAALREAFSGKGSS
jgi:cytochrome c biogenesis protein CcmG, thiol:disulfide interchange protein DsbE